MFQISRIDYPDKMIFVMCGAEISQNIGFRSPLVNNLGEDFQGHEKEKSGKRGSNSRLTAWESLLLFLIVLLTKFCLSD